MTDTPKKKPRTLGKRFNLGRSRDGRMCHSFLSVDDEREMELLNYCLDYGVEFSTPEGQPDHEAWDRFLEKCGVNVERFDSRYGKVNVREVARIAEVQPYVVYDYMNPRRVVGPERRERIRQALMYLGLEVEEDGE